MSHSISISRAARGAGVIALMGLLAACAGGAQPSADAGTEAATPPEVNVTDGYAVHGYDVVAYFTQGAPVEGVDAYTAEYQGATYRFANAEHRDLFAAAPQRYAPAYGGYCAFGTAQGRKFDGDPEAWTIHNDTLYLNLNTNVRSRWQKDIPGYVRGADNNWALIQGLDDATLQSEPPEGLTLGAQ